MSTQNLPSKLKTLIITDDDVWTVTPLPIHQNCSLRQSHENVLATAFFEAFTTLISIFSVVGNILVIYVIRRSSHMAHPMTNFIFSLALSDLIQGVSYPIYIFSHNYTAIKYFIGQWPLCCTVLAVYLISQMASAYNLVGLIVVRYVSIRNPLRARNILNQRAMVISITVVWLFSITFICALHVRPRPDDYCGICQSEMFWSIYQVTGMLALTDTLPSLLMITAFCLTLRAYSQHVASMKIIQQEGQAEKSKQKNEKKLSLMTSFLVAYFFLSYLPFIVYTFRYILCDNCTTSVYIRMFARLMMHSNISVNFVAYVIGHDKFRKALFQHTFLHFFMRKYAFSSSSSSPPPTGSISDTV